MNTVKACFDSMHSQGEKVNKWRETDLTSQAQGTEDTMGQKMSDGETE